MITQLNTCITCLRHHIHLKTYSVSVKGIQSTYSQKANYLQIYLSQFTRCSFRMRGNVAIWLFWFLKRCWNVSRTMLIEGRSFIGWRLKFRSRRFRAMGYPWKGIILFELIAWVCDICVWTYRWSNRWKRWWFRFLHSAWNHFKRQHFLLISICISNKSYTVRAY